jgi:hypothetical protein
MSNYGQAILTIVGTVVGSYFGYPQLGLVLGSLAGQALFPTQLPSQTGPRLSDVRSTNSQIGAPVQEVFGIDCVAGTVIYLGPMQEVATTEEVGGKGGPEQDVTTYTYFQTIAVGLCRGPKDGLRRIWENGKLVYDRREQLEDESDEVFQARVIANAAYEAGFVLYLGTNDQLPDPTIEADRGVGNTPAYRDLMYIVYPDRELQQDQALRQPNFKFEITSQGVDYVLVAVASSGGSTPVMISRDGTNWEAVTTPEFALSQHVSALSDVCFSPELNLWVAASRLNANVCIVSQDGENWTLVNLPAGSAVNWSGVAWSPDLGLFAMCASGGNTDSILTSPDGVNWTRRVTPAVDMQAIARFDGLGLFIAVGLSGFALISADGITWTSSVMPGTGRYVILSSGDRVWAISRSTTIAWTTDGINWTDEATAVTSGITAAASRGDGRLVLSTLPGIWFNTTGTAVFFEEGPGVGAGRNEGATWAEGLQLYIVVGTSGADGTFNAVSISPNGTDWTEITTQSSLELIEWTAVCEGVALQSSEGTSLAAMVREICSRVGVTDIDVSDLEDRYIYGYVISRVMSADAAIEPLRKAGFFDIVESGTTLKFVARGASPVRTLVDDDLGAHDGTADMPAASVTTKMAQDIDLPRQLRVHFRNPDRDYEDDEELSPSRLITDAVNDVDIELPMALEAEQAAQIADVLWAEAWTGRFSHQFALDNAHSDLDASDVLLLPVNGEVQRVRIITIDDNAFSIRRIEALRDDDGSYVSYAVTGTVERVGGALEFISDTLLEFLDLPPLRTSDTDAGFYVAVSSSDSGTAWRGAAVYRSIDDGNSFQQLAAVTTEATVCELVSALPSGELPGGSPSFDENTVITVELMSGTLESRIESDVFSNGANTLAVGAKGRWLIVSFCRAVQITETTWELSKLLWGRRGTEHFIGTPLAGDRAVLISGNGIIRLPLTAAQIDEEYVYKAVSISADFNDGTDYTYAGNGQALEPFSPTALDIARQANGDILITWTRRDRLGQELTDFVDPISDPPLSFEVDIFGNGSPTVILRTITSSVESATYTNAQQFTDSGSPTPTTLTVRVYQISATVGRGQYAELTESIL